MTDARGEGSLSQQKRAADRSTVGSAETNHGPGSGSLMSDGRSGEVVQERQ